MRVVLAFVAVTVATMAIICWPNPSAPVDPCVEASKINAQWVRDASLDGASGSELTAYCQSMINDTK